MIVTFLQTKDPRRRDPSSARTDAQKFHPRQGPAYIYELKKDIPLTHLPKTMAHTEIIGME